MRFSNSFSKNISKISRNVNSHIESLSSTATTNSNALNRNYNTSSFINLSSKQKSSLGNVVQKKDSEKSLYSMKSNFGNSLHRSVTENMHRNYSQKLISGAPFAPEIVKTLREPLSTSDIEIKPDGILYLPEIKYRRILNKSFGPGGWAMVPQGDFIIRDGFVCQQFALYADGRFVASSWGEQSYDEQKMRFKSLATSLEGAKSNGLMRCCKDLGIASELWDPQYIIEWKKHFVAEVWATNRVTGKKKKLYRRKDRPPFDYPWVEEKVIEGGGASAEWAATFDIENTADIAREDDIIDEDVFQPQNNQQRSRQFTPKHSQNTQQTQTQNSNRSPWSEGEQAKRRQFDRSHPQGQYGERDLKQKVQPRMDDFEDDDDDIFSTTHTPVSRNTKEKVKTQPKQKVQPIDEDDFLDSDGEPDMFADFNDEPEDQQEEEVKVKPSFTESNTEPDFEEAFGESPKVNNVNLDLNEVVYFGKYRGKTWNEILRDRSFLNYAKWAESKMRPGEVKDKILAAYHLAKEMQQDES